MQKPLLIEKKGDEAPEAPAAVERDYENFLYSMKREPLTNIKPLRLPKIGKLPPRPRPIIDSAQLRDVLCAPIPAFSAIPGAITKIVDEKENMRTIHIDRGSNVLAVAHLDSVKDPDIFWISNDHVGCPTIDNRLGAWVIMYGLASMGMHTDILLTEGEETHNSTARKFQTDKKYNWMFSFDRGGSDVVMYDYMDYDWNKAVKPYGLTGTYGAYSDIQDLQRLGCKAMNIGCGMMNYHQPGAYANLKVLVGNMQKLYKFWEKNKDVHFPHTIKAKPANTHYRTQPYLAHNSIEGMKEKRVQDRGKLMLVWSCMYELGMNPDEWWDSEGFDKYGDKHSSACSACKKYFHPSDTFWMATAMGSVCASCFAGLALGYRVCTMDEYTILYYDVDVSKPGSNKELDLEDYFRPLVPPDNEDDKGFDLESELYGHYD